MKRIVKRNNESTKLEILNLLITIDYVLPKAITWLRRRNEFNRVCAIVLNRNLSIVKRNLAILCCYTDFNFHGQYIPSCCLFHLYDQICVYILKNKKLFLKSFHWKQNELARRPISSIRALRKIALNLSHFETQKYRKCNCRKYCICEAFFQDLFVQLLFCGLRKRKYLTYTRLASP